MYHRRLCVQYLNEPVNMKKIILWGVPRSVSTALERVFLERDDTVVFHEPFSPVFYYSKNRLSQRYSTVEPESKYEYQFIRNTILSNADAPILFIKELAFHLPTLTDHDFWREFTHTFIIRKPEIALPSQYKLLPDISFEEAGYVAIKNVFDKVVNDYQQTPIVIDGEELRRYPEAIIKQYCQLIDIPFQNTLRWKRKTVTAWQTWSEWHKDALESTGIFPPSPKLEADKIPPRIHGMIEAAYPYYLALAPYAISVKNDLFRG